MDTSKLRTGEIVASLGGLALFVILFLDWVGAEGTDEALSGWDYLGEDVTGFIVFLAIVVSLYLGCAGAAGRRNRLGNWPWGGPTAALGVLAFDIVVWRLFTAEGVVGIGGELEFGIFLGLFAAAAIAVGGFMTMAEGGVDPFGLRSAGGATATTTRSTATTKPAASKPAAKKAAAKRRAKPTAKKRAARRR